LRPGSVSVIAPWLCAQDLGGDAQATLLDYLGGFDTLELRRAPRSRRRSLNLGLRRGRRLSGRGI